MYQTLIRKMPTQVNELWNHAALPKRSAHSEAGEGPHVLNVNNVKNDSENKNLNEDRQQRIGDQKKLQYLAQQPQEVSISYKRLRIMALQKHKQEA